MLTGIAPVSLLIVGAYYFIFFNSEHIHIPCHVIWLCMSAVYMSLTDCSREAFLSGCGKLMLCYLQCELSYIIGANTERVRIWL